MNDPALVFPLPTFPMTRVPLDKRLRKSSKLQEMFKVNPRWPGCDFM